MLDTETVVSGSADLCAFLDVPEKEEMKV